MLTAEILNYILAFLALGGVFFGIWNKIRSPQVKSEKKDALLSQEAQWAKELNETRFNTMQESINSSFELAQNHIHSVDTKVDVLMKEIGKMKQAITKLETIIQERIPREK